MAKRRKQKRLSDQQLRDIIGGSVLRLFEQILARKPTIHDVCWFATKHFKSFQKLSLTINPPTNIICLERPNLEYSQSIALLALLLVSASGRLSKNC
ncbi:MAG: hypothetical protein CMJ62_10260 [Planctomycetaceae bacterium]|nr:hypothetical protein [Planctomycetaceae bacterium]